MDGKIATVSVVRGAPCGATWEAARKIIGRPAEEAAVRMGLEVQFFCSADPAGWDPIYGKSPVHFAGNVHAKALEKAMRAHLEPENRGSEDEKPYVVRGREQGGPQS